MSIFSDKKDELPDWTRKLRKLSDEGNPEAQWHLACKYVFGVGGCPKDLSIAIELFQKSAMKGFAQSSYNLGCLAWDKTQEFFPNAKPNYSAAFLHFKQGSDIEFPPSMTNLGEFYLRGYGTVQSYQKAHELLMKAARYSYDSNTALFLLGKIYLEGLGVKKNLIEAHKYFNLAAKIEKEYQSEAIELRSQIEPQMELDDVLKAQNLALEYQFEALPEKFHLRLTADT